MTPPIKLDARYLPFEEYARRQHLDLVDTERLIDSGKARKSTSSIWSLFHAYVCVKSSLINLKYWRSSLCKSQFNPISPIFPTNELASRWNVSENSIRNMIRDGKLPVIEREDTKGKHYVNMAAMWQHAIEDSDTPENQRFFISY